jgi:hypothetical protein
VSEGSHLPLSMIVTPVAVVVPVLVVESPPTEIGTDCCDLPPPPPALQSQSQQQVSSLSLLTNIPKCYHCGAPHSTMMTYERYPMDNDETVVVRTTTSSNRKDHNSNNNQYDLYFCRLCHQTFTAATTTITANEEEKEDVDHHPPCQNSTSTTTTALQQQHGRTIQRHMTPKVRNTTTTSNNNTSMMMEDTQLFDLPLRLPTSTRQPQSQQYVSRIPPRPMYRKPSMECPIVWYICLDGGTLAVQQQQNNSSYWKRVSETIQTCLETAPPHVHIALLIASQRDSTSTTTYSEPDDPQQQQQQKFLSIYNLHSPVPMIQTYSSDELACTEMDMIHHILYDHTPVPCTTSPYCHHIRTALRSLVDYPSCAASTVATGAAQSQSQSYHNTNNLYRCPVGWVTEVLLTSYQYGTVHVGHRRSTFDDEETYQTTTNNSNHTTTTTVPKLVYSGLNITFFLCDRPAGLHGNNYNGGGPTATTTSTIPTATNSSPQAPIGERYTYHTPTNNSNYKNQNHIDNLLQSNAELTPESLQDQYQWNDHHKNRTTLEYYADLGRECSDMAMSVNFILLYDSTMTTTSNNSHYATNNVPPLAVVPNFGVPLFQSLSERSGAPGPLLWDISRHDSADTHMNTKGSFTTTSLTATNNNNMSHGPTTMTQFQREVLSRTPWQDGRVFGAELRVRLSSGYRVDPSTVSRIPNRTGPQLAPLYNEAGCFGPASSVQESSQLWRMGTSDPYTSYTFDLTMDPNVHIRDHITLEGIEEEISLYPVIQICFAYTTIVTETDVVTGELRYYTVRQMRITNRIVPFAYTVEALYASVDTEALAVVLFHRIVLANYQDGIVAAADMAQQWLQCLLVCIYKSAMVQFELEEENRKHGLEPNHHHYYYDKSHRYYYPGERLLFLEGELSAEDVLLAQGHERLRPIVLMVYLLLQCDPFRCRSDYYLPSTDVRSATISHMSSMTPTSLTRCIAPRIQLWESGHDVMEPIYDVLDLRSDAIQAAILECTSTSPNTKNGRSSPGLILFLDTPEQIVVMDGRYVNNTNDGNGQRQQSQSFSSKRATMDHSPLVVGVGLQTAITDAANSYRVRPTIIYELDQSDTNGERTLLRLVDYLIEDTYHIASQSETFNDWRCTNVRFVLILYAVFICPRISTLLHCCFVAIIYRDVDAMNPLG